MYIFNGSDLGKTPTLPLIQKPKICSPIEKRKFGSPDKLNPLYFPFQNYRDWSHWTRVKVLSPLSARSLTLLQLKLKETKNETLRSKFSEEEEEKNEHSGEGDDRGDSSKHRHK